MIKSLLSLTIILRGRAGWYITNEARSAELVMIISYPASPSRIIVLLKTLRHIIENLKKKSERKERSFRENRKKEIIFRSNVINKMGAKTFRCVATFLVKVE